MGVEENGRGVIFIHWRSRTFTTENWKTPVAPGEKRSFFGVRKFGPFCTRSGMVSARPSSCHGHRGATPRGPEDYPSVVPCDPCVTSDYLPLDPSAPPKPFSWRQGKGRMEHQAPRHPGTQAHRCRGGGASKDQGVVWEGGGSGGCVVGRGGGLDAILGHLWGVHGGEV
jgi:hypothetical protein